MLFIHLCAVFNMLQDKPFANSQVNAIAEYFLLKTAMNQTLLKTRFEIAGF